jgi:predicted dehydrogenase/nucleoside-diphosphate-sugar epimerase
MTATAGPRLRVAIVGAGYVAQHHLAALKRLDYVDLIGICDLDRRAAESLAQKFGITQVGETLADLAVTRPDAVHVLTPPASHCPIALQALAMGCHVLVEKPMAETVAECDAMIAMAAEKKRLLMVNHSDLFDPIVQKALAKVQAGRIGDIVSMDVIRNSDYPAYAGGPLPGQVAQGSYPFRDLGVHGLYTLEAFLGPIAKLDVDPRASGADPNIKFDDWTARAACANGIGRLLLSWRARPMENRFVIRGTRGTIEGDRFLQTLRVNRMLPGPKFIGLVINAWLSAAADLFRVPWNVLRFATGMLKASPGIRAGATAFADAARDGAQVPVSGEDGRHIVALLEPGCAAADGERRDELESRYQPLPPADVLVTGSAGFLGRSLLAALRARGERVRVLVRKASGVDNSAGDLQIVVGDLGDPKIVAHAVAGVRRVYHVGAAMRGSVRDFEAGTLWGTRNIVDACVANRIERLIHVSSLSVLDHAGRDPAQTVSESSSYEPYPERRGAYTQTKLTAEKIVRDAVRERGLKAVILRPGQIFGPGAEKVTPNGALALAGRWVAVGSPDQTLPLVYRDDVVDAILLAARKPEIDGGEIFNIVDPEAITQQEFLDHAKRHFGDDLRVMRVSERVFMALGFGVEQLGKLLRRDVPLTRYRVRSLRPLANFDLTAARYRLGWEPTVGVRRGLAITYGETTPKASTSS